MGFLLKNNVSKQENKIKTGFIFKHNILNKKNKSWVSFQKSYQNKKKNKKGDFFPYLKY